MSAKTARRPVARLAKPERQSRIIADLRASPALRVNDLASRLSVSTETVRRDLAELEGAGLISRTYGGATRPIAEEPGLAVRVGLMVAERQRIAEAAVALVEPGDHLMIGGGATTLHFARCLAERLSHLTIITHAFSVAQALAQNATHRVLMLPGQYDGREGLIHGPDTIEALGRFRAARAFLGASGLTGEGPSDAALGPGMVYRAMSQRAAATVILADHSKFDAPSLTVYRPWSAEMALVTDRAPTGALAGDLEAAGTKVIVA